MLRFCSHGVSSKCFSDLNLVEANKKIGIVRISKIGKVGKFFIFESCLCFRKCSHLNSIFLRLLHAQIWNAFNILKYSNLKFDHMLRIDNVYFCGHSDILVIFFPVVWQYLILKMYRF